ncbi:MAG: PepSY domain-containing protein [Anaerolineae bacterium]
MKIKRTLAIAAVALLLVGGTAATTMRSFAQTPQPPAQVQTATAPDNEKAVGADTDQIDEQVGDQSAADTGTESAEAVETPEGAEGQDVVPAGTPAITADQAKAAAEAHLNAGTATKVQLDDENGKLVYSVEIGTSDVKVDAMTGAVLGVDSDGVDGGPDYQG